MKNTVEDSDQRKLQRSLFRSIFNESVDKMMVLDHAGLVSLANNSMLKILDHEASAIVGKHVFGLMLEKDRAEFSALLETVAKAGVVHNYKFYLLNSRGSIVRFFLTTSALYGEKGELEGYCIYLALANTEEWAALKDPHFFQTVAKKLGRLTSMGQLTSIFAHDIKNPLHVILSTSELLLSAGDLDEELKPSIVMIERNAQRASRIVKTLLDFSRSGICQLRPYSVNDIAEYCLGLFESSLKTSKVTVARELGETPKVFLDPHYMHSVVYNLLTNALESVGEKEGRVELKTLWDPEKKEVRLAISDDGRGMDRNMLDHLFQPFFTTKETGTGLGLYLARQIMNEHSGEINVWSEPGKGARVELLFRKIA